ncbi:MAG: tetratricopeptide repeat protein [Hyphomonadaceae bacterium]
MPRGSRHIVFVAAILLLPGCVGASVSGATYAVRASQRGNFEPAAERGDPEAQYRLGMLHCCMGPGFSAQTATEWLCRSAHQGYAPAQFELGRIYAGEIARTPTPGQQIVRVVTARRDPVRSHVWFQLAAAQNYERAADRAAESLSELGEQERAAAGAALASWQDMPCRYDEVFRGQ